MEIKRFMTANTRMSKEQIISTGLNTARQVISGIIHRLIMMPGTIAEMTEANAMMPDSRIETIRSFIKKRRNPKMTIMQEIKATAIFAL
jgi:hypothetical protein